MNSISIHHFIIMSDNSYMRMAHRHVCTYMCTQNHTCTHTHTHTHTHTRTHTHTHTHTHTTHTHTHTHTHTCTQTQTQTHTHTHTRTHTHTHTRTHTLWTLHIVDIVDTGLYNAHQHKFICM